MQLGRGALSEQKSEYTLVSDAVQPPKTSRCFFLSPTLTASFFIGSIPTVVHKVTQPQVLHAGPGVRAVEMRATGTLGRCQRHRAVPKRHVVKGGDAVEKAKVDLGQSNAERLRDASQLHRGLFPLGSLVEQGPPNQSAVCDSSHSKVDVHAAHRDAGVVMPSGQKGEQVLRKLTSKVGCQCFAMTPIKAIRFCKSQLLTVISHGIKGI